MSEIINEICYYLENEVDESKIPTIPKPLGLSGLIYQVKQKNKIDFIKVLHIIIF